MALRAVNIEGGRVGNSPVGVDGQLVVVALDDGGRLELVLDEEFGASVLEGRRCPAIACWYLDLDGG